MKNDFKPLGKKKFRLLNKKTRSIENIMLDIDSNFFGGFAPDPKPLKKPKILFSRF